MDVRGRGAMQEGKWVGNQVKCNRYKNALSALGGQQAAKSYLQKIHRDLTTAPQIRPSPHHTTPQGSRRDAVEPRDALEPEQYCTTSSRFTSRSPAGARGREYTAAGTARRAQINRGLTYFVLPCACSRNEAASVSLSQEGLREPAEPGKPEERHPTHKTRGVPKASRCHPALPRALHLRRVNRGLRAVLFCERSV